MSRLPASLVRRWYRGKTAVLSLVRHGRPISRAPDVMNLGNLLTLGRWAYQGVGLGERRLVLMRPHREKALDMFPTLKHRFFIPLSATRFTDQRLTPWAQDAHQRDHMGVVPAYVHECLLPGSPLLESPVDVSDALVVNVRRGEYYSDPVVAAYFGFNVAAYVATAVDLSLAHGGTPARIHVVSDDVGWCHRTLHAGLSAVAPVTYGQAKDPVSDMAALVRAPRLILANSTFSYWGGFIGDVLSPGREVWAPWLFCRSVDGGDSRGQLSPAWDVVTEIPGGWGPPEPDASA